MVRSKIRDYHTTMTVHYTLPVDEHYAVGPLGEMYGHDAVTVMTLYGSADGPGHGRDVEAQLYVCLTCGYTSDDKRTLLQEDCDRAKNPINMTWDEHSEESDGQT